MMNNMILALMGTLMYATPLLFAALGGVVSELSGVMNIGIEGVMTFGAFVAATVSFFSGSSILGFALAGVCGGVLILLHAITSISLRADQTISGTAINFLGPGISVLLTKKLFDGSAFSPPATKLPSIFPQALANRFHGTVFEALNGISSATLFAFFCVFLLWFVLYKTKWGLRIRATGEYPAAVDTMGVSVTTVRYCCVLASGVLAGFGGAFMSLSVTSSFSPVTVCGHGFIALAAMIFGNWKPHGTMLSCLLLGFAMECTTLWGGSNNAWLPVPIMEMFPYLLTIVILILFVGELATPKANGIPYVKGSH
ncbi:MAG: ABC transporter permease [Oscillospiraceae bacterium]|jgi:simple sugar transport system permease protein|nr:ABC transporter permease [Oscillospiraceae bacterium]